VTCFSEKLVCAVSAADGCAHVATVQAYTTLSNPMARLKYNAQLEQALQDEEDDYTGRLQLTAARLH